jgi:dTDP-D-glucose 4,6-dehydratase
MRPNLHIDDMCDVYRMLLDAPANLTDGETFNVGAQNMSIIDLARLVQEVVFAETGKVALIETKAVIDTRSYQVNSDKIRYILGYVPERTIEDAVRDLCKAFANGLLLNSLTDDRYFNVQCMRKVWADVYKDAPPSEFDATKGVMSEIDLHRMRESGS